MISNHARIGSRSAPAADGESFGRAGTVVENRATDPAQRAHALIGPIQVESSTVDGERSTRGTQCPRTGELQRSRAKCRAGGVGVCSTQDQSAAAKFGQAASGAGQSS